MRIISGGFFITVGAHAQSAYSEYWSFELIHCFYRVALGIGAASFWSVAEKDRAESPTAIAERPKNHYAIPNNSISNISVEPPGMPGCE